MAKRKKGTKQSGGPRAKKATNPTAPTPIPSNPPEAFPTEIFDAILSKLRYDTNKTTLARCTRVSKTFKVLATPYLYETLEWEHMLRDPTVMVKEGKATRGGAKDWITRNENVRHIKMVHVQPHAKADCPRTLLTDRRRPLVLPLARIDRNEDHEKWSHECSLLKNLAPRRLVFPKIEPPCSFRNFAFPYFAFAHRRIEELVLQVNLGHTDHPAWYWRYRPKRLIIILSPSGYANRQGSQIQADMNLNSHMAELANNLAFGIDYCHMPPSAIILVNFDKSNEHLTTEAGDLFEGIFIEETQARLKDREDRGHVTRAKLASLSHSFISMREYLTTFDWEGVYTKAEVDRMLKEPDPRLGEE